MTRRIAIRAVSIALCAVAAACGGSATSPASQTPTGYLMTVTPAASCAATLGSPLRVVVKYTGEFSGDHVFQALQTVGGPRDPILTLRFRNSVPGVVEGSVYAGFAASNGSPGLYFRMPETFSFPAALPFTGTGDVLKSDVTAMLDAYIWNAMGACAAMDHRLRFERVFDTLQ